LTLDDGQLCPVELEQALQGDSLLLMACSAGYYQLAQVYSPTIASATAIVTKMQTYDNANSTNTNKICHRD